MSLSYLAAQASSRAIAPRVGIKRPRPMATASLLEPHVGQGRPLSFHRRLYHSPFACESSIRVVRSKPTSHLVHTHQRNGNLNQFQQQLRWNSSSGDASNKPSSGSNKKDPNHNADGDNTPSLPTSTPAAKQVTKKKKKRRRRKESASPLAQITNSHPKSTSIPLLSNLQTTTPTILTRKQILRLTPKQRSTLHSHRLEQSKNSQSYLSQARTNVRANINFLKTTADTNLKKNIDTLKRLFQGEEVWKDDPQLAAQRAGVEAKVEKLAKGIDWERAPQEIQQNFQSNLGQLQNWLHSSTNGLIPRSTTHAGAAKMDAKTKELGPESGSIATRLQAFHQMKQQAMEYPEGGLVMDNVWIAKNVAFALLPGTLVGLYLWSLQGEMKEYYGRQERFERERILGVMGAADDDMDGADGDGGKNGEDGGDMNFWNSARPNQNKVSADGGGGNGKMGISHALIPEGGSILDKLKMAVNDLLLGGVEERIEMQKKLEAQQSVEEEGKESAADRLAVSTSASAAANPSSDDADVPVRNKATIAVEVEPKDIPNNNNSSSEDPTIQMLLQRIQSLEKQLGTTSDDDNNTSNLSEQELQHQKEEQRKKEHQLKYRIERIRQSPMQNRRDNVLAERWREEEEEKRKLMEQKKKKDGEAGDGDGDGDGVEGNASVTKGFASYTVGDVIDFAMVMMKPTLESMKKSGWQTLNEIMSAVGLTTPAVGEEKAESGFGKQDAEEDDTEDDDARVSTSQSATDGCKSADADSIVKDNFLTRESEKADDAVLAKELTLKNQITEVPDVTDCETSTPVDSTIDNSKIEDAAAKASDDDMHTANNNDLHGTKQSGGIRRWAGNLWRRIRKPKDDTIEKDAHAQNDNDKKEK